VAQALNGSPEVQKLFDLKTKKDEKKILDWASEALKPSGPWGWINETSKPLHDVEQHKNRPFGVNLYGFAFGELGTGEDLRMAVEACERASIPYRVINIDTGSGLRQADLILKEKVERGLDEAPYAINVFCLPGFDTIERIFLQKGDGIFRGHYNIGWWPWEISVWPKKWNKVFTLMDEIWAGSTFALSMYEKSTSLPINLMPLPVSVARGRTHPRNFFKLPQDEFLFLFVFDFNSHLQRKNPQGVVDAFLMAFPKKETPVGLILKVMNTNDENPEWKEFLKLVKKDDRIKLIEETLDRPDVLGLIECCDAYVSLHRGEGFGRTLAEAMLYGKSVIATNYSGNVDFMEDGLSYPVDYRLKPIPAQAYPFIEESDKAVWAEPNIEDAASKMKAAFDDHNKKDLRFAIKNFAAKQFSVDVIGKMMRERLTKIDIKSLDRT
jgi:glycosyltransferase involved in cell wall biosynthesis